MPRSRARKRYADNENGEEEEERPDDVLPTNFAVIFVNI